MIKRRNLIIVTITFVGYVLFCLVFCAYDRYFRTLQDKIDAFVERADSEIPPGANMISWGHGGGEPGAGWCELTIWADGRSKVVVTPHMSHLKVSQRIPEEGWIKHTERGWNTFIRNGVYTEKKAQELFREAFRLGINLLEPVKSDRVIIDGRGVRVVFDINGIKKEQNISVDAPPISHTENYLRFKALFQLLGDFDVNSGYRIEKKKDTADNKPGPADR